VRNTQSHAGRSWGRKPVHRCTRSACARLPGRSRRRELGVLLAPRSGL